MWRKKAWPQPQNDKYAKVAQMKCKTWFYNFALSLSAVDDSFLPVIYFFLI